MAFTPKWHYLYFVLAAFDLFAVSAGLYLTHTIMGIYTESVAENQEWAERGFAYAHLRSLAAAVNAPGNDIFETQDVEGESGRMQAALQVFDVQLATLRKELRGQPAYEAAPLEARLKVVEATVQAMTREARQIFADFRARHPVEAARRMAAMDKRYDDVNTAFEELQRSVVQVQQKNFDLQTAAAARQQKYEYAIGFLILLMVAGATTYGYRQAKQIQASAADRERHLRELGEAQERRRLALHALQETHHRLQVLFRRTLQAQEQQRQHIARELHEEIAHMLASLAMRLTALRSTTDMTKSVEPQVRDAGNIAQSALQRVQALAQGLAPHGMEYLGLGRVLESHLKEWTLGVGVAVHFSNRLLKWRPPFEVETAAYRVVEEAVANVVRHARAHNVYVQLLQTSQELHASVSDDGAGFDVESIRRDAALRNTAGLTLMEERTSLAQGELRIVSERTGGTTVHAIFRYPPQGAGLESGASRADIAE